MKKTNHGSEIVTRGINTKLDYMVTLLRKTSKAGEIRHFVVVTNHATGKRIRFPSTLGIQLSYNIYKGLLNA